MVVQKYTIFMSAAMLYSQALFSMLPIEKRPGKTHLPFHCDQNRMVRELRTLQDTAPTPKERTRFCMISMYVAGASTHDDFKGLSEFYTDPAFVSDGITNANYIISKSRDILAIPAKKLNKPN